GASDGGLVGAAVRGGLRDGGGVFGLLDAPDGGAVARGGGADGARVGVGEVEADGAVADVALDVGDGAGEAHRLRLGRLEDVKGEALGAAAADAGKARELVEEALDGFRVRRGAAGSRGGFRLFLARLGHGGLYEEEEVKR